jgi:hypothetical protein
MKINSLNYLLVLFGLCKIAFAEEAKEEKLDASVLDDLPGRKIKLMEEVDKLSSSSDQTIFLYIYHRDSINSRRGVKMMQSIEKKLRDLVEVLHYDCTENVENMDVCKMMDGKDNFPRMMCFVPPENRVNPYTKEITYHSQAFYKEKQVNELLVYNFITENIKTSAKKLNSDNIDEFLK